MGTGSSKKAVQATRRFRSSTSRKFGWDASLESGQSLFDPLRETVKTTDSTQVHKHCPETHPAHHGGLTAAVRLWNLRGSQGCCRGMRSLELGEGAKAGECSCYSEGAKARLCRNMRDTFGSANQYPVAGSGPSLRVKNPFITRVLEEIRLQVSN